MLAFGAGALISAVSFDLAQEGAEIGSAGFVGLGLALGALTYFSLNRVVEARGRRGKAPGAEAEDSGSALALGAFLDGIPEQLVLGMVIAAGDGVSIGLLVAIFVSNLPEAIGSSTEMRAAGTSDREDRRLWTARRARSAQRRRSWATAIADSVSGDLNAAVRRVRRGRAARDADRLDDPRRGQEGRRPLRAGHRARLRGRRRAFGSSLTPK